ncbi:hypothetical protein [Petrotoga sp. 9PWA.NaAc.5.4]|uniref:hypothetical protein n=1 Tax=Petrotoga sp. 9PWA.NaAc.5.4 TaxID=1434328 RepID=UPI000CBDBFE4|nr:hypothetical protein [Petrotoga sp. 9PWA.NaAc.5.4]PNR94657.1 hypothetical protein X924_05925 [Petrotoga sp. 9PWA.NaAc.5.4]
MFLFYQDVFLEQQLKKKKLFLFLIFSRFSEKEIDKKEDKLQLSKKVENIFSSIPEDSNFWKKEQTIKPDGYNVYLNKTFIFFINFILYFKNEADKYRNRKNYS